MQHVIIIKSTDVDIEEFLKAIKIKPEAEKEPKPFGANDFNKQAGRVMQATNRLNTTLEELWHIMNCGACEHVEFMACQDVSQAVAHVETAMENLVDTMDSRNVVNAFKQLVIDNRLRSEGV